MVGRAALGQERSHGLQPVAEFEAEQTTLPRTLRFCETRIHLQQISFFIHLLAFPNLLEIARSGGVKTAP